MLLSERSPELDRHDRTPALPIARRIDGSIRAKAPRNPDGGGLAFSTTAEARPDKIRSGQPDHATIDPLYLFMCAWVWRERSSTCHGWELVSCLRSSGQTATVAAALLADAEDIRPPVRALVRAIVVPGKPTLSREAQSQTSAKRGLR